MATAAIIAGSEIFERRASESLGNASAASEAAGLAPGALAHHFRLMVLARRLGKLNASLESLFSTLYEKAEEAKAGVTSANATGEQIQEAGERILAVHLLLLEVHRRCAARDLTNYARFGVAAHLHHLRDLNDKLWGVADWLHLVATPAEYENKMRDGDAEIET